tara:strand:- start:13170 stop:14702 length:1533 start_codon:yes stop_codon:yes gene_type:complete
MSQKILFWLNGFLLHFGLAYYLQQKLDDDFFAIIDVPNRPKTFFLEQNLVTFNKKWFLHDHITRNNSKLDIDYLNNFEKNYSINLWELGINERIFYKYNKFHKFSHDEILKILEQECKFYEKILDEIQPDFLITFETALHYHHLFYEMCKKRGIKILMLQQSKLGYQCMISQELHKIDNMPKLSDIPSRKPNFEQLREILEDYNSLKQIKTFTKNFGNSKSHKMNALLEYVFSSDNSNEKNNFTYYGRTKMKVIMDYLSNYFEVKKRKSFIDKNFEHVPTVSEKYVLFPMNQDPERTTLISAPFYTNQLEFIRNISRSLPPGYKLYVKEHFAQVLREWRPISYYKEILDIPNVRLFHPFSNMENLMKNSSLVISIGGSASFLASFYEKPSMIIADHGYTILSFIHKINSIEELPSSIRKSLNTKVIPEELDRYLTVLEDNSFEFDLKGYEILEENHFNYGGNYHDTIITNDKMKLFLENNRDYFEPLATAHIKKLDQFKQKQSVKNEDGI